MSMWTYAVETVRRELQAEGLQAAIDMARLWQRNVAFDAGMLLAEAKTKEAAP